MAKTKKRVKDVKKSYVSPFINYWVKENYIILFAGLFVLLLGFFLMAQGPWNNPVSMTISPIVLLIAYLVIFPLSILYKKKKNSNPDSDVPGKN